MTSVRSRRRAYIRCNQEQKLQQRRVPPAGTSTTISVFTMAGLLLGATAFTMSPTNPFRIASERLLFSSFSRHEKSVVDVSTNLVLFSSVGDGNGDDGNNNRDDSGLGEFLDPMKKPDSEDMKRAREYMSETSLPISFDSVEDTSDVSTTDDDGDVESKDADLMTEGNSNDPASGSSSLVSSSSAPIGNATSSALFGGNGGDDEGKGPSPTLLAKNPYMQVVSKISPSDLIAKFTAESDPRVQEAVRTTILGLIGSLPKLAFETTSVTTGQRLASLVSNNEITHTTVNRYFLENQYYSESYILTYF